MESIQKWTVCQFWRLEAGDQGAGRADSFWGLGRKDPSQTSLWPVHRHLPVSSHCFLSMCLCVHISPSYKESGHTGGGPTINDLTLTLLPLWSHSSDERGEGWRDVVRTLSYLWGRWDTIQPISSQDWTTIITELTKTLGLNLTLRVTTEWVSNQKDGPQLQRASNGRKPRLCTMF